MLWKNFIVIEIAVLLSWFIGYWTARQSYKKSENINI